MKKVLTEEINGQRWNYYKFNDGTYGFNYQENWGGVWVTVGGPDVGWSKEALELEHDIQLR